jgi:hypothetical protein
VREKRRAAASRAVKVEIFWKRWSEEITRRQFVPCIKIKFLERRL